MSFLKEWPLFIKQNYTHILFIPLFYSFEICYTYIQNADFNLHRFPGRMIGTATLNGLDIAIRASLFYNSVFLFLASAIFFYFIFFLLFHKKQHILKDLIIVNITSLVGCLLLFLMVFNFCNPEDIYLIIIIHVLAIFFLAVRKFILNGLNKKLFDTTLFSIVLCISISFLFLFKECIFLLGFNLKISFEGFILVFNPLAYLVIALYFKKLNYPDSLHSLTRLSWLFIPVALIPLFTPLKNEIYLILANKGIPHFSRLTLYLAMLMLTAIWIYRRNKKGTERPVHHSMYGLLSNYYFPFLILGVTTYIYYNPVIVTYPTELFENANRFLPIMEFLKYHTVPLLEKFNSHMFSEIFTIYIYSILNKMNGLEPLIYDFFFPVSSAIITYFIVRDFTRNPYIAVFIVLIFPLTKDLITVFAPALLAVYILFRVIYRTQSVKNYILLLLSFLFFVIWKIDLGVATVAGMITVLVLYSSTKVFQFNFRFLLAALGYISIALLLIYFLFLICGINLASDLLNQYNYLSSAQSYGYNALVYAPWDSVFDMHYFIFPAVTLLLGGYILFYFKKIITSRYLKFATICLLFCIGFYITNFERGLVRHGFAEKTDIDLSSFIFFILSGSVYFLNRFQSQVNKFLLFFFASTVLLIGFKYPTCNPFVVYESFKPQINKFSQVLPQAGASREIDASPEGNNVTDFRKFISANLKADETFIDFANQPMLYYYTQKITPSFFYQSPLSMHNDYLQKRFLENLGNYKTPLLLFSSFPIHDGAWEYNSIDWVPNALRHYQIAEYLFQQYQPFVIVGNYCLWKSKQSNLENNITHLFTWKNDSNKATFQGGVIDSLTTGEDGNVLLTETFKKALQTDNGLTYKTSEDSSMHKMDILFSDTLSGTAYYVLKHDKGEKIKFYLNGNITMLNIDEVKYIPDFYSTYPHHWDMDRLPYIWANYDEKIHSAPVQKIIADTSILLNSSPKSFALPSYIDKSTGNYIYISLDVTNESPITVQFSYGPSNGWIDFTVPRGNGIRTFAIRVSSQYNWYAKENTSISLFTTSPVNVTLKKILLLKGDYL